MPDPITDQREDTQDRQQGFQSNALYAITQFLSRQAQDDPLMQDARRYVNALNPGAFTFGDPAPPPVVVPQPVRTVLAMDVSSHQGKDLSALIDRYRPEHVICKSYQAIELGGGGADYTIKQAHSAVLKGCTVGYYIWLYAGIDGARQAASGLDPLRQLGATPPVVWLDCESYLDNSDPDAGVIRAAVAEVERQGFKVGIYTGAWWWNAHTMRGSTEFSHLPLWSSQYDGVRSLEGARGYGGWDATTLVAKQFQGSPIDLSVIRSDYAGL